MQDVGVQDGGEMAHLEGAGRGSEAQFGIDAGQFVPCGALARWRRPDFDPAQRLKAAEGG